MEGGEPEHQPCGNGVVGREDGADQAPCSAPRERNGRIQPVVGDDRADGTESLDLVNGGSSRRVLAVEQRRGNERAAIGIAVSELELPPDGVAAWPARAVGCTPGAVFRPTG